jgi:hypothetical protein
MLVDQEHGRDADLLVVTKVGRNGVSLQKTPQRPGTRADAHGLISKKPAQVGQGNSSLEHRLGRTLEAAEGFEATYDFVHEVAFFQALFFYFIGQERGWG